MELESTSGTGPLAPQQTYSVVLFRRCFKFRTTFRRHTGKGYAPGMARSEGGCAAGCGVMSLPDEADCENGQAALGPS